MYVHVYVNLHVFVHVDWYVNVNVFVYVFACVHDFWRRSKTICRCLFLFVKFAGLF